MRLTKARIQKYRCIRDTGWFDVEQTKTILVGPNEAGKTAVLLALEQLNPGPGVAGFDALRDYPRSELNDLDRGTVMAADITVVEGEFRLESSDREAVAAISRDFVDCTFTFGRRLDKSSWCRLNGGPQVPNYQDLQDDLLRLAARADRTAPTEVSDTPTEVSDISTARTPSVELQAIVATCSPATRVAGDLAQALRQWLEHVSPLINGDSAAQRRYRKLMTAATLADTRSTIRRLLTDRLPTFVYFSNYFRVHPLIHLEHLAVRTEQNLLDDEQYDFGNNCLLKLIGLSARELSNLGRAAEPAAGDAAAMKQYRDQLDRRHYKLNAADVALTKEIRRVWQPPSNPSKADHEELRVRIRADQQYLKVVVEDELGVEIELDQRSEGFQWLISFFVVFFAQAEDSYRNAILLLDDPGLSLHGLRQRDFRVTLSRLADTNQLMFTTHSPFLVGPDELDCVRVVEMTYRSSGTKVHLSVMAEDPTSLLPLQEALGYDLAQSLFAQQRNLVLEGLTDYWYVEATASMMHDADGSGLRDGIALIPAGTAGKVVYFATILHAHRLKVAALLDSDSAGDSAASQETLVHALGQRRILRTKDAYSGPVRGPEIEDLLRYTLTVVAKSSLGWDVADAAAAQPSRPILDVFKEVIGKTFSKYHLAKAYLRWTREHSASDLTKEEQAGWERLIGRINAVLK